MTRRLTLLAVLVLVLGGCTSPVPRDRLAEVDDFTLLKQMVWLDRPAGSFDFGPGGRDGYIADVRAELLLRHDWPEDRVDAVRAGRVELGMTMGQVVTSVGWPNEYPGMLWAYAPGTDGPFADDLTVKAERARANRWSYGAAPKNLHVWFRDGRVWNIIDNRTTD